MILRLVEFLRPGRSSSTSRPSTSHTGRNSSRLNAPIPLSIIGDKIAYLDGLKGFAALSVVCHTFIHAINQNWDIGYGFGIPLFCVQAGYRLAIILTPYFQQESWDDLLFVVASYLFNRTLRIFLPAICATFMVLIMIRHNLYDFALTTNFEKPVITRQPELYVQLVDWWKSVLFLIYPLYGSRPRLAYIPELWALPVLLRDSMICILAIIGIGRCRRIAKMMAFGYLLWQSYQNEQLTRFSMLGGVLLAEIDTNSYQDGDLGMQKTRSNALRPLRRVMNFAILLVAILLMACPRHTERVASELWHHIGAILAIFSINRSDAFKNVLSKARLQYLGRISLTIYTIQSPVIFVVGYRILGVIVGFEPMILSLSTILGVSISLILTLINILSISYLFWHFIDLPIQSLAEWIEINCLMEDSSVQFAEKDAERFSKASEKAFLKDPSLGYGVRDPRTRLERIGWYMIPSWIQESVSDEPKEKSKVPPTAYLDGLRGWASLCVLIYHSTYDYHPKRSEGYGFDPRHSHLVQLPIIRLIYTGPTMVWIFYAISGFALSLKPLQQIHHGQSSDKLVQTLSSYIFRRTARLYLPVMTVTFLAMLGIQAGSFKGATNITSAPNFSKDYEKSGVIPRYSSFFYQFWDWLRQFESQLRMASRFPKRNGYNPHSWTIPVEFDGSMVVFSVLLTLAKVKNWVRISCIAGLIVYLWHINRGVSIRLFLIGVLISESFYQQHSPLNSQNPWKKILDSYPTRCLSWLTFFLALFLLSVPWAHAGKTPGYKLLVSSMSEETLREIGVPLLLLSIQVNKTQQSLFTNSFSRFLGKISFSLYLCQFIVIYTLGKALIPVCLEVTGQKPLWRFELGFWAGNIVVILVTFWIADIFRRAVDLPSVSFARWLEQKSIAIS